jgi:hypothetical protein
VDLYIDSRIRLYGVTFYLFASICHRECVPDQDTTRDMLVGSGEDEVSLREIPAALTGT